jgi:hypothetical protein
MADLVLVGDVYRVDAARTWASAVAIAGDRIVAVGTESEVRERVGSAVEVVRGAAILPGMQDAHIHPAFGARNLANVNLDDLDTPEAYLERIRAFADAHPEEPWIVGGGWMNVVFADTDGPTAAMLDGVVPDRPAFLMNNDVHGAWVNTRALERGGITASTPDPWDGYFVRDASGSPTGTLQEGAAYRFWHDVVPLPDREAWARYLRLAQRDLHALGVTGWQDAWVEPPVLEAYRSLRDAGELTMRVVASLWWERDRGLEQVEELAARREEATGGNLHATTVKIMLDGCPETATSAMLEPFEGRFGEVHGHGIAFVEPDVLREALVRLDAAGFQVHQHALGDRAVRMALDAVEAAREENGWNDHRHHLAHLQLPDPADVPRLRRLGVVANMQPYWAQPDPMIDALTRPRVGERVHRLYPIADVLANGTVLAFGSDWPVSTPDPWLEIEVAVTRANPGGDPANALEPEQRIALPTAIAAFTRGSAYVNHDDEAGTVAEGARADFVVVDRNPFEPGALIGDTKAVMTIASGRVVHDAT